MAAILEKEPPPVSIVQPLTPPGLDRIVHRCLAKDPDARWQSAADLAAALSLDAHRQRRRGRTRGRRRARGATGSPGWPVAAVLLAAAPLAVERRDEPARRGAAAHLRHAARVADPDRRPGDFAGRNHARLERIQHGQRTSPAVAAAARQRDRTRHSRHGRGDLRVLVARQPESGLLRGSEAQARGGQRRRARHDLRHARRRSSRRQLGQGRRHHLFRRADRRACRACRHPAARRSRSRRSTRPGHTTHRWPYFLPDGRHFLYFASSNGGPVQELHEDVMFASVDGGDTAPRAASDVERRLRRGPVALRRSRTGSMSQPFDPASGSLSGPSRLLSSTTSRSATA